MSEQATVRMEGVGKLFHGVQAVEGVDLEIRRGEFFALLGPSGCGKTTLLRMVAGFEMPDRGSIRIGGRDMTGVPANERPVNMVFQQYALFPHLSVAENVAFGLRVRRTPEPELRERVAEALASVQLAGLAGRMPAQLSGGQQQRVALARALVNRPELLLLDEPMAALDEKLREDMRQELKTLQHRVSISFLYVTHDQQEALELADRIAVMERGKVVQVGAPQEIYEVPQTAFVADFVGVSNLIPGKVVERERLLVESAPGASRRVVLALDGFGRVEAVSRSAMETGARVTLCLRPERIHLAASPVEDLVNRVLGMVERALFLGSEIHYHIRLKSGTLVRVHDSYSPLQPARREGESVYLQWRAEDSTVLTR